MTDFSQTNPKAGKCSNFGNCSLADSHTTIQVPVGRDFACTECGKSLLPTDMSPGGGSSKNLMVVAGLVAVLLAAGAGAWLFLGKKEVVPEPAPVAAPAPAVVPAPAATPAPALPATGHCSDADAQAGLCQKR
jgi:phosphate transport system substrate-binding protein